VLRTTKRDPSAVRAIIAELERKQLRRMRELLMAGDERLTAIDAQIAELRKQL
jgi:hypothetical protein